jgi:hypothetical protein
MTVAPSEILFWKQPLFLPGALLVAVGAELLAPFMLVDLALSTFL